MTLILILKDLKFCRKSCRFKCLLYGLRKHMLIFPRSYNKWYYVGFNKYGKIIVAITELVLSVIAESDVSVITILDMYSDDLPSPLHFNDEVNFMGWKRRWTASKVCTRPDTIVKALKKCNDEMYPNLSVFLTIAGTVAAHANSKDHEVYLSI